MMNEWISVKDKLPEEDTLVIAYSPCWRTPQDFVFSRELVETDGMMFARFSRDVGWLSDWTDQRIRITYWIPFPQPPEDKDE